MVVVFAVEVVVSLDSCCSLVFVVSCHNCFVVVAVAVVVVGDVDHNEMENLIKESFKGWKQSPLKNKEEKSLGTKASSKVYVTMQDKTSTDFVVGTALGIDRYHPDYLPLYLATHTLGGNFSARLMQTVRVKEGLTYGINSSLSGFGNGNDGYWMVGGTFSPKLLSKGENSKIKHFRLFSSMFILTFCVNFDFNYLKR